MEIALWYHGIYLFIVTLFTVNCYNVYNRRSTLPRENIKDVLFLALFMSFFIGLRPQHDIFADTVGYVDYYKANLGYQYSFDWDVENLLFDNLLLYMSSLRISWHVFFIIISFLYFVGRYFAYKKLFPDNSWIAYLMFLGAFISFASATNGIKAGVGISLISLAIAYRDNKWYAGFLLILSWGFHHAMHVCIIAFIICLFYKKSKHYFYFWIFGLVIAILHIQYFQYLFGGWTDDKGSSYLSEEGSYMTGMRYDFVLYSSMPLLLYYYLEKKYRVEFDDTYKFVLNLYMLLNGVWLLCMYANFTNRIASLSWGLYSITLAYPFLSPIHKQIPRSNKLFAKIFMAHLGFTLFMNIFYY